VCFYRRAPSCQKIPGGFLLMEFRLNVALSFFKL
jgi:hypothetical protein